MSATDPLRTLRKYLNYGHVKPAWFALALLSGCHGADDRSLPSDNGQLEPVLPYNGDLENFTASGFARHSYSVRSCKDEIELNPPFEVSENGWGSADIRAPLSVLDDAATKDIANRGINAQSRVSYAFPSLFRGEGLKESFAGKTIRLDPPRALATARSVLGTEETRETGGIGGETHYLGKIADGREMALLCTATNVPNPTCTAELTIGCSAKRYMIIFPPKAVGKLNKMVMIGDKLFADAAARCPPQ